jgi:hypothetical protein
MPDTPDPRFAAAVDVPDSVDLRDWCPKPDQEPAISSTAAAGTTAVEVAQKTQGRGLVSPTNHIDDDNWWMLPF